MRGLAELNSSINGVIIATDLAIVLFVFLALTNACFAEVSAFSTPITPLSLDNAATAAWVAGVETSWQKFLDASNELHWPNQLSWFVVMDASRLGHSGISFGADDAPGPRHLRVGLTESIQVGTVITRGNLTGVSVLKSSAAYPGDLGDDTQWISAERVRSDEISVWVLPVHLSTKAFRFTHESPANEHDRAGKLLGVSVLAGRYLNLAPHSLAFASRNGDAAAKLIDGSYAGWANGDDLDRPPLSSTAPEWIMLAWPRPVTLRGLCAVMAIFGQVEVQYLTSATTLHPREASEEYWQKIATGTCAHRSPESFNLNWLDFGRPIATRGVRIRILSSTDEGHYLKGQTREGKRCYLGELLALSPIGDAELPGEKFTDTTEPAHPPIPIEFMISEAGYVTLVVEDMQGNRVRNLIGETLFQTGKNTAYWDGLDESGRIDGPYAGIYRMVGAPVIPGKYRVRGLFRKKIDLKYEFSVYSPGSPPWLTGSNWAGGTGGWLADHSPPAAVLALPGTRPRMLLASPIAESSHGVIWTDLAGNKLDGKLWVGGNWTGASHLARDSGQRGEADVDAYSGIVWEGGLRLVAFRPEQYDIVVPFVFPSKDQSSLGGLSIHNGLLVASLPKMNALLFVDAVQKDVIGTASLSDGRGLAFDKNGFLFALSGRRLLRYPPFSRETLRSVGKNPITSELTLPEPEDLLSEGLLDPQCLTIGDEDQVYVGDWGDSHQVKVFGRDGKHCLSIGKAGGARAGAYDPQRMDRPHGISIAPDGHLWVAESSFAPKRVSVWTLEGRLVNAFYGPPQYGGGGTIDRQQPERFYHGSSKANTGLEFLLEWKSGRSFLNSIYYLPRANDAILPNETAPQTPIYVDQKQYMTDVNNSSPIGGPRCGSLWLMINGLAQPVASIGMASGWPLLWEEQFSDRWPRGTDPKKPGWSSISYVWSDLNDDAHVQPEEVTFAKNNIGSLTLNDRLEFCTAAAEVFKPRRFTNRGTPIYELTQSHKTIEDFYMQEVSSGSGQIIHLENGWTVGTGGPMKGIRDGRIVWTYPNEWPGQQAGVFSTPPTHRGELMATTRLMGVIKPRDSDAGEILVIQGDKGNVFLMTADGLFVSTLFHDLRISPTTWSMAKAEREMLLNDVTTSDEDFWSTATQIPNGNVYLVAGKSHSSIVRVDGLESVRRLKSWEIEVTPELLDESQRFRLEQELKRVSRVGHDRLTVRLTRIPPTVDGSLDEWSDDNFVTIDERSNARLNAEVGGKVEAAVRVSSDRLFVAYKSKDPNLLENRGDAWQLLFKTGGAFDLMVGTNPAISPNRSEAEEGDLRLLVTLMRHRPIAVLYQPVSSVTKSAASFSSPWRTISFDRVVDISLKMQFAAKGGNYEFSVPLDELGLLPKEGLEIRGDIGLLRGNGFQTVQRQYWQNKSTSTVADVPTEATLTPKLWGIWTFQKDRVNQAETVHD